VANQLVSKASIKCTVRRSARGPNIELAKAIALLSIRMKRCATNDAWADARLSLDQASDMPLRIFFVAEAAMEDPYETLGVERSASADGHVQAGA